MVMRLYLSNHEEIMKARGNIALLGLELERAAPRYRGRLLQDWR